MSASGHSTIADTLPPKTKKDTLLRITNLNPFFSLHVDSVLQYRMAINREQKNYYWYINDAPVGVRINKDNGLLTVRLDRSYFLSGKLQYDTEYTVNIGVQGLRNARDRVDTSFSILFYNTEIVPSVIKPSVSGPLKVNEGEAVNFTIQCENGSFPVNNITFFSNTPLVNYSMTPGCDGQFSWTPKYDFVKETDSAMVKVVVLNFVGANKFSLKDTAMVTIVVHDALDYQLALAEYNTIAKTINSYILQLKYTFLQLDRNVRKTKGTRTTFDITGSATALSGSVMGSSPKASTARAGQILPGIGVSLIPMKEAIAPPNTMDENQAALLRSSIRRMEYMLSNHELTGQKDWQIKTKTENLRNELRQMQVQLVDMPVDITVSMNEEELEKYFNSKKMKRKYRVRR